MKKIIEILSKNIFWKLLSLVSAVVLWSIVITITDPVGIRNISRPITIYGLEYLADNNIVILNIDDIQDLNVNVRIFSRRSIVDNIAPNSVMAYIDLSTIDIYEMLNNGAPTSVELPILTQITSNIPSGDYEITTTNISSTTLRLDSIITRQFPIVFDQVGYLSAGLTASTPTLDPSYANVTGPKTYVNIVDNIKVSFDVTGLTDPLVEMLRPMAFTTTGTNITDRINIDTSLVELNIGMVQVASVAVLAPATVGSLSQGYTLSDITFEPQFIEIIGEPHAVRTQAAIRLPAANLSGLQANTSYTVNIQNMLNPGVTLAETSADSITVNLFITRDVSYDEPPVLIEPPTIEQTATATIALPLSQLQIIGTDNYVLLTQDVFVDIVGLESAIQNINPAIATGQLDLSGLEYGEYNIMPSINLPAGITVESVSTVWVLIPYNIIESEEPSMIDEPTLDEATQVGFLYDEE